MNRIKEKRNRKRSVYPDQNIRLACPSIHLVLLSHLTVKMLFKPRKSQKVNVWYDFPYTKIESWSNWSMWSNWPKPQMIYWIYWIKLRLLFKSDCDRLFPFHKTEGNATKTEVWFGIIDHGVRHIWRTGRSLGRGGFQTRPKTCHPPVSCHIFMG